MARGTSPVATKAKRCLFSSSETVTFFSSSASNSGYPAEFAHSTTATAVPKAMRQAQLCSLAYDGQSSRGHLGLRPNHRAANGSCAPYHLRHFRRDCLFHELYSANLGLTRQR